MSTFSSFIKQWSTTPASNGITPNVVPYGWPEGMAPSDVNNVARQNMTDHRYQWQDAEWFCWGDTASKASVSSFKVATDVTTRYIAGRRLKLIDTTTKYATIRSSSYSAPDTTVNLDFDDTEASLAASPTAVALGILSPTNPAIPNNVLSARNNIIIGGNFDTNPWQRGTSFSSVANSTYTADRIIYQKSGSGVIDILKTADAPTLAQCGMTVSNCFHVDVTTADNSLGASDQYDLRYIVEGYDFAQIFGRAFTLSFWHKHTKTGTHNVCFFNSAFDQYYCATYTQTTTDTWEKAVISVPAYSTGTWLLTNGAGMYIDFPLAMGSTLDGAVANTWTAATAKLTTTGHANNLDNTANNFKLALIKLEVGANATPYPVELRADVEAKCQRYCRVYSYTNTSSGLGTCLQYTTTKSNGQILFDSPMRAQPTGTYTGTTANFQMTRAGVVVNCSAVSGLGINNRAYLFDWDTGTAGTAGQACLLGMITDAVLTVSAELS